MNREKIKNFVMPFYNSSSRFFHNWNHIKDGLKYSDILNDEQYIAWLFHDIIYLPGFSDNENSSAKYLSEYINSEQIGINSEVAIQIILDTKNHIATFPESQIIQDIDMLCMAYEYTDFVLSRENVAKEYIPFYGKEKVEEGIIHFLESIQNKKIYHSTEFVNLNKKAQENINEYISQFKKNIFDK